MLGKIWGLVLLSLGIYVAFEVSRYPAASELRHKTAATPQAAEDSGSATASADKTGSATASPSQPPVVKQAFVLESRSLEEIAAELAEVCDQMQAEIKAAKLPISFKQVNLQFREKRLATAFMKSQLAQCFRQSEISKTLAEIEVFSSDFAGEDAAHQIQLQVSLLEAGNQNKIYEVGRKFEMSKRIPKPETRSSPPQN